MRASLKSRNYSGKYGLKSQSVCGLMLILTLCLSANAEAGEIRRALFTTGIDNREPVTIVDSIDSTSSNSISFYTEITNMSGQTITHQWTHLDKVMFEKTFEVKAERWRVWTSKTLIPNWTGTWTVNVLDADRELLTSKSFEYQ
jgi:hypothetical protein